MHLTAEGLRATPGPAAAIAIRSALDLGDASGSWCPFGAAADDADEQRRDDAASVVFDTAPVSERTEILGAPVAELELSCDRPLANLIVRLCDVDPDGASLRVSYGVLNLAHRDSHERPSPLEPGRRYRVRLQLNDVGFAFIPGHRIRLALSTTYWPMIWPAPETATITLFTASSTLSLPVRAPNAEDTALPPLPPPETAPPAARTTLLEGRSRQETGLDIVTGERFFRAVEQPNLTRIEAIGTELGSEGTMEFRIRDEDPLSARVEVRRLSATIRGEIRTRTELGTSLSASASAFRVEATLDAFEGERRVCSRAWSFEVPRDLL